MIHNNPIILKEFVQTGHQRRTYLLRAALPAAAAALVAPEVLAILRRVGQDWRAIAQVGRPIFTNTSWLQLIAFSLIAFVYATASLHTEWTHKTIDVLCASPLSRAKIVYGKFLAVMGKVLMAALALLPVMGIWFHLGRIPREIALGTMSVIAGSTLLFGAVGLMQAAAFPAQRECGGA